MLFWTGYNSKCRTVENTYQMEKIYSNEVQYTLLF